MIITQLENNRIADTNHDPFSPEVRRRLFKTRANYSRFMMFFLLFFASGIGKDNYKEKINNSSDALTSSADMD